MTETGEALPGRCLPTIAEIQSAVCGVFGLSADDMTSASRIREIARPRQIAMYLARELTPRSMPEIGRRFGHRDHTTVIHAYKTIAAMKAGDSEVAQGILDSCLAAALIVAARPVAFQYGEAG